MIYRRLQHGQARRERGFTLFELGVTVAVIAILMFALLSRLAYYREEAERLAYQQVVTALRAEVRLKMYGLVIANRQQEVAALAGQNPFNWLQQKPANYLGEYYSPNVKELENGHWFFDRSNGNLVYLLNQSNTFATEGSELPKFKVSLLQVPGTAGHNVAMPATLDMVPVQVRKEIAVK